MIKTGDLVKGIEKSGQYASALGSKETNRTSGHENASHDSSLSRDQDKSELDKQVKWHEYLPRLRKSIRGMPHPIELKGNYWPQRNRSITYRAVENHQSQQRRKRNGSAIKIDDLSAEKRQATRETAAGSPLRNDMIRDQMHINGVILEQPRDESPVETRSKFGTNLRYREREAYDRTYLYQSQSTMQNTDNRFLSPRLSNPPIAKAGVSLNQNFDRSILSKALLEKIA